MAHNGMEADFKAGTAAVRQEIFLGGSVREIRLKLFVGKHALMIIGAPLADNGAPGNRALFVRIIHTAVLVDDVGRLPFFHGEDFALEIRNPDGGAEIHGSLPGENGLQACGCKAKSGRCAFIKEAGPSAWRAGSTRDKKDSLSLVK